MSGKKFNSVVVLLIVAVMAIAVMFTSVPGGVQNASSVLTRPTPSIDKPPYSSYKGVAIGTTMDEARAKFGVPKEKSEGQDFFEFSAQESAQVYYDGSKKVTAITITYTGKLESAPTPKTIFGEDAEVKPDGGISKMIRYPKAGFWISYNKTGGEDPIIMIAIQKM